MTSGRGGEAGKRTNGDKGAVGEAQTRQGIWEEKKKRKGGRESKEEGKQT